MYCLEVVFNQYGFFGYVNYWIVEFFDYFYIVFDQDEGVVMFFVEEVDFCFKFLQQGLVDFCGWFIEKYQFGVGYYGVVKFQEFFLFIGEVVCVFVCDMVEFQEFKSVIGLVFDICFSCFDFVLGELVGEKCFVRLCWWYYY